MMKDAVDILNQRIAELEAENERLRKQNEIQKLNLQLRTIDGSMDEHELIEDAERLRWINLHTCFTNLGPGFYELPTLIKGNTKSLREAIDAARRE